MKKILSATLAAAMALAVMPTTAFAADKGTVIKIFHTNDVHSRVKASYNGDGELTNIGYAKLKTFIEGEKADGKLVLDAGDVFHGQSIATLENGNSIAQILKAVGYDAISPGNHDFNYGTVRAQSLGLRAGVKMLAANVRSEKYNVYPFSRYMVKDVAGVKVGIFGLSTPETAYKTNPKNVKDLTFGDETAAINTSKEMVELLQGKGCDVVIALTHLGVDETSKLKSSDIAEQVEGIDLIIDGHSHSELFNHKVKDTYIASTGEYMENVGVVTLTVQSDGSKTIEPKLHTAKELQDVKENATVANLISAIDTKQSEILNKEIGKIAFDLQGERNFVRGGHTNLGNLLTSAMLKETGAEIALTNGGGIRASIAKGSVTKGDIITVLPFGNYIVTKELTGKQIIAALEHGMTYGAGSFTHYAGMTATTKKVDVKNADGTVKTTTKVLAITTADGKALDPDKKYVVATNDFMAVGGDDYTMLAEGKLLNEFPALDEALIRYIANTPEAEVKTAAEEVRLIVQK